MPNNNTADLADLRQNFDVRLRLHVRDRICPVYKPHNLLAMLGDRDRDALNVVREVLRPDSRPVGLWNLWQARYVERSVEQFVLDPRWQDLFTPGELAIARSRLAELNVGGRFQ